eukprot:TRINITY_DN20048_c0_g1_i1.p1 TRINITY_DN20048_c0_g1~~TRINITY_DN20048_c0_g1_i1.p1  ORF type:complete len:272 (+),score=91.18 TRINITY_DN20048_c0_g1_i1:76-816(+)
MALRFAAAACLVLGAAAYPEYLECANDTATRLRVGGPAVMSGPPTACGSPCNLALTASTDTTTGQVSLTIVTTATVNFAVRVSDGAGKLSSSNPALTSKCDGQMYTNGGSTPPPPGSFKVVLTPPKGAATAKGPVFTVGFTDKFGSPLSIVNYPPQPTPPPAPATYKCQSGQCVPAEGGVAKAACEQLCVPAVYRCINGSCVAAAGGVSNETCSQLCVPETYRCIKNTCQQAAGGVDFASCQQLCS